MEIRDLTNRKKEWNEFVHHNGGTIFHTYEWSEILEKNYKTSRKLLGFFEHGELKAAIPLYYHKKGIFTIVSSPLLHSTPYGGFIGEERYVSKAVSHLEEYLKKVDVINMRTMVSTPDVYSGHGYDVEEKYTYYLPLRGRTEEEIWMSFRGRCRRAIRKGEKNGVVIRDLRDDDIDRYYEMIEMTYEKWNIPPPLKKQHLIDVLNTFPREENVKALVAERDGIVLSGAVFLIYNSVVYYWDGCSDPEYYKYSPNNLLHWELIKWALQRGLDTYDMVGANMESIARFKESFSPVLKTYYDVTKVFNPLAKAGKKLYTYVISREKRKR